MQAELQYWPTMVVSQKFIEASSFCLDMGYLEDGIHGYEEPFTTSPSIPRTHMPHSALKRQVSLFYDTEHE